MSSQILAALLNAVGRLSLVLDTADSMATLYHLFSAMDPSAISMKVQALLALFLSLTHTFRHTHVHTHNRLFLWLY